MAPIETEYGKRITTGDSSIFVHADQQAPAVTSVRETDNLIYRYYIGRHTIKLRLRVECDSDDNGGIVKSKITRAGWLRTKLLKEGEFTVKGDQIEETVEVSPGLIIGFRAKHRRPETKSK